MGKQLQKLPSACALIVAGGSGSRFGDPRGKQFVPLAGRPMIAWPLLAFDAVACVSRIVVVLPADRLDESREQIVEQLGLHTDVVCVAGGASRQESVRAGLAAAAGCEIVAIHDAARPLVTSEAIERVIASIRDTVDCALLAAPVVDTLKRADGGGTVLGTIPRETLWTAQTPQVMRYELAAKLHEKALLDKLMVTDDASLAEHYGYHVIVVDPNTANFKVTIPEDLVLAEAVLRSRLGNTE